ncbi:recombinase family protein [Paenibacillus sp. MSJ-34]|uniref:recombinase family protein n=1 Tax=Paenibacillus sp. MSJ-34 TaxID=2841529 RepID=UPI001C120929|nr:recombinase family protein [Paenibacillus sp. MSJ-34]MBU5443553.1 recombinase family protein [Paenibacillus sp. MSJ-34]
MSHVRARKYLRYVIYARVSTKLDSQKDSLESQVSFFENYIREMGGELVGVYADDGITGKSTARRKELKRLLKDVERGTIDVVLIKSLSRLSRDTSDTLNIVRKLHSNNVELFSSREGLIKDEMMLSVISAVNQRQSEDTSYNVSWGIAVKSNAGIFHGTAPFGYDKVKGGKLVPNTEQALTVKLIFDLYLNKNMGYLAIANYLNEKGIPSSRKNGQKWHDSSVRILLSNRHYTGELVHGRSKVDGKDKIHLQEKGYNKRQIIDEGDWIVIPNHHEPIITREQFKAVQEKRHEKAERRFRGKGKKSLFARVAFCADCGSGMNYIKGSQGYVCGSKHRPADKECTRHFIKHAVLKEAVLNDLRKLSGNTVDRNSLVHNALKQVNVKITQAKEELNEVNKQLRHLQKDRMELVDKLLNKTLDDEIFKMYNSGLKTKQETLELRVKELENIISQEQENEGSIHAFQLEVQRFTQLEISDEEILREVFHRLIHKVEVFEDGSIEIHYNFKNPLSLGA